MRTNTLIHADHHTPASILVIKRPDSFSFRNPGRMRVSVESALYGALSDCRNRRLQTMFQLVGFGDIACSGVPKIFTRWAAHLQRENLEHKPLWGCEASEKRPPSGAKFAPKNTHVAQTFAPESTKNHPCSAKKVHGTQAPATP